MSVQLQNLGAEVTKALQQVYEDWRLAELLRLFPELSVEPVVNGLMRIVGGLTFSLQYQDLECIADSYTISIEIPEEFPRRLPIVRETDGRIPKNFHIDPDGTLCLGSPTRLQLALGDAPTLPRYVKKSVLPFLYSFSYFQRHGVLPFGQLDHGSTGIRDDYANLFGVTSEHAAQEMVRLASLRKRHANKYLCPCGTLFRVGRCHHRRINRLRSQLGRLWFRGEYQSLVR